MNRQDNTNYVGDPSGKKDQTGHKRMQKFRFSRHGEAIGNYGAVHLNLIGQTYSPHLSQVPLLIQMKLYGNPTEQRRGVDYQLISQQSH